MSLSLDNNVLPSLENCLYIIAYGHWEGDTPGTLLQGGSMTLSFRLDLISQESSEVSEVNLGGR